MYFCIYLILLQGSIVASTAAHFRQFDSIDPIPVHLQEKGFSSVCLWSISDWNWHVRSRKVHWCDIRYAQTLTDLLNSRVLFTKSGLFAIWDIRPKRILISNLAKSRSPITYRVGILDRSRQWYCRTLREVWKRLDDWHGCYGQTRFLEFHIAQHPRYQIIVQNEMSYFHKTATNHVTYAYNFRMISTWYTTHLHALYILWWVLKTNSDPIGNATLWEQSRPLKHCLFQL